MRGSRQLLIPVVPCPNMFFLMKICEEGEHLTFLTLLFFRLLAVTIKVGGTTNISIGLFL